MRSLLVVTGPPGAGKSTVAEAIGAQLNPSAVVEGDAFFRFLRTGWIAPWLPEADDQNTIVTYAAGAAAGRYATGGLHTIYDGVIGPWFLDDFLASTGLTTLEYAVLLPPVDLCVQRVLTRENHGFKDEAATRHMHDQFTSRAAASRHVFYDPSHSAQTLAADILDAQSRGRLRYPG